jgi:transposase-like protein
MRYPASEKAESKADRRTIQWIVVPLNRLIEQSHLSVRRILEKLGIPRATFHRWVDLYQTGGSEALEDRPSRPSRVWNRIPDEIRAKVIALALEQPELSPRELAVRFTDEERHFVSEASVYRLSKPKTSIASPAYLVIKAADEFTDKARRTRQRSGGPMPRQARPTSFGKPTSPT